MLLSQKYGENLSLNYSPFGAILYGRNWSSEKYRYGFQGQERDDEIKGSGNSYDFGARIQDPRLGGRFLSIDRLAKPMPWQSPYSFANNNPVLMIDLNGDKGWPTTNQWNVGYVKKCQSYVSTEIQKIQAKAMDKQMNDKTFNAEACRDRDICFDCADLAYYLLIKFTSDNGLPLEFTTISGDKISSEDDYYKEEAIDGVMAYYKKVADITTAATLLKDVTQLDLQNEELMPGDISNTKVHVDVVVAPVMYNDSNPNDKRVNTESGSQSSNYGRVPRGANYKRTDSDSFQRWNVLVEASKIPGVPTPPKSSSIDKSIIDSLIYGFKQVQDNTKNTIKIE